MIKKFFLSYVILFCMILPANADKHDEKCITVKGIAEKLKCVKGKYENVREKYYNTNYDRPDLEEDHFMIALQKNG